MQMQLKQYVTFQNMQKFNFNFQKKYIKHYNCDPPKRFTYMLEAKYMD